MRVALVHSFYSSAMPSGENVVVEAQARALASIGVDVTVIAARTDEEQGVRGYKLRSAINVAAGTGRSPVDELGRFKPDVTHIHNMFPNWGTKWLSEWPGPVVATVHNFRPVCAAGTLYRDGSVCTLCPDNGSHHSVIHACYRDSRIATIPLAIRTRSGVPGDALLNRADRVIMLSDRVRETYADFGLASKKVRLIPNFVDDVGYEMSPPGDHWVYIGRLSSEKGIVNLLRHWPENEQLRIYGDGPLREFVETNQKQNVRYLGSVRNTEVPAALKKSRGLIFSSEWYEGAPLIYVESLAAGRAVVALEGNGVADDVKSFGGGLTFSSWEQLAPTLMTGARAAHSLGVSAREQYEQRFTEKTWTSRMIDLYNEVIGESR
jgi:glycosyltransferase involved in cell wall biosynthesis